MKLEFPEFLELIQKVENLDRQNSDLLKMVQVLTEKLLPKMEDRKYKVKELADLFGVERQTVYNWFKLGLKYEKIGERRYIYQNDLNEWVEKNNRILNRLNNVKANNKKKKLNGF